MYHAETWREKIGLFLTILWPIVVTQVSFFAMKLIDTMMAGRVGAVDLAGGAIGASLWMPIFTGMNGILLAVTPIVAQLIGSNERHRIADSVRQALYVALMLAIAVVGAGALVLEPVAFVTGRMFATVTVAAHQIAFNFTSLIFRIPPEDSLFKRL